MTEFKGGNFAFTQPPFASGDVVHGGGNYTQLVPETPICVGVENVTVYGGNFVNCVPPASWDIRGGNWAQISLCSHTNPHLIALGLPVCAEACAHRVAGGKQWIEVPEGEFRTEKNRLLDGPLTRIDKDTDADGVEQQTFRKEVYVYEDVVLSGSSKVLRAVKAVTKSEVTR